MQLEGRQHLGFARHREALQTGLARCVRDRGVTPAVTLARRPCRLAVSGPGLGKAHRCVLRLAAAVDHPVQRGQVLGTLDAGARAAQDALSVEAGERLEPELLRLRELRGVLEGAVVLVVVVQTEQREDLVDRIDPVLVTPRGLSRPSCGR